MAFSDNWNGPNSILYAEKLIFTVVAVAFVDLGVPFFRVAFGVKLLSTKQNYAGMLLFRLVCHLNRCRQINGRKTKYERLLGGNQTGHAGCFGL
jgi:hypothetical protein